MGGLFGGAPSAPAPAPAPTAEDPAIEEARRKEVLAATKQKGRAASLLTGADGDTTAAPVTQKRLLGE